MAGENRTEKEQRVEDAFKRVAKGTHFKDVEAEITCFRDMKIKWTRSWSWIRFEVSDYLADAPDDVLEGIASTIFDRIEGKEDASYTAEVNDYLTSGDFVKQNQEAYVSRCRGLSPGTAGEHRDLRDSYLRLLKEGLVEEDPDLVIRWASSVGDRTGYSSVLMHTAVMYDTLDREDIPDSVLDYALYAQLCHIYLGWDPFMADRKALFWEMVGEYPEADEASEWLHEHGLKE